MAIAKVATARREIGEGLHYVGGDVLRLGDRRKRNDLEVGDIARRDSPTNR